jgi:carbon-monoxide dehydrogenase medium subunit
MKASNFEYVRVKSLDEAVKILSGLDDADRAQVMAGGQSLLAMMNLRVAAPDVLVDISRLAELRASSADGDMVTLGACTTHAAIEDQEVPDPSAGMMRDVASRIAYRAVRTQGTLGGSLALSDPAADWVTAMPALDARLSMISPRGRREVKATDFMTGIYETVREQDEIIESVRVPKLSSQARWGFSKFCRKTGEFASSLAAVVCDASRDYARVVLGGVQGPPIVLTKTSASLQRQEKHDSVLLAIESDLDIHRDKFDGYERGVHRAMLKRAIGQVIK